MPYEAEKSVTVSQLKIASDGDQFPVWVDPSDPSDFAFGMPETEEAHRQMRAEFGLDSTGPDASSPAAGEKSPVPDGTTGAVLEIERLAELRRDGAISCAE